MTQPPPPPYQPFGQQPYGQQPSPYGQPPKKGNKTLWIVLGIVGGVLLLCCGGGVVAFGLFVNEVDNQIDEERENDTPSQVDIGEEFEHDDFVADAGWQVTNDNGYFAIEGLVISNESDTTRSPGLEFSFYREDILVAELDCTAGSLAPDEKGEASCGTSFEEFDPSYDEVRVSDQY